MKKIVPLALLLTMLVGAITFTSPKTASAQSAGLVSSVLNSMERNRQSLRSLRANLSMEKYNAQLRDSEKYSGVVLYIPGSGRDASVRIEWQKPQHEILAVANGQYTLFRPRLNMAYKGSSKSSKNKAGGVLEMMYMSKQQLEARFQPVKDVREETLVGWREYDPPDPRAQRQREFQVCGNLGRQGRYAGANQNRGEKRRCHDHAPAQPGKKPEDLVGRIHRQVGFQRKDR